MAHRINGRSNGKGHKGPVFTRPAGCLGSGSVILTKEIILGSMSSQNHDMEKWKMCDDVFNSLLCVSKSVSFEVDHLALNYSAA